MLEFSDIFEKLRAINKCYWSIHTSYLYKDPAYSIVYSIMGPYKNYLQKSRIATEEKFNKTMAKLQIELEHGFAIYQNLWAWNNYYLQLKVLQGVVIRYVVSVFLLNIQICLRRNQTSYQFAHVLLAVEKYLKNQEEGDIESIDTKNTDVETIDDKQESTNDKERFDEETRLDNTKGGLFSDA